MADLLAYVGRRLIQLFLVIWVAGTINFIIPRLIPGDPVASALAKMAAAGNAAAIDAQALKKVYDEKFGLDKPLWSQYLNYWGGISGDLGVSLVDFPQPVIEKIQSAVPWTLGLLTLATVIAFVLGSILGALLAWPRAPRALHVLVPPFMLLSSIPFFLLAIVLVFTSRSSCRGFHRRRVRPVVDSRASTCRPRWTSATTPCCRRWRWCWAASASGRSACAPDGLRAGRGLHHVRRGQGPPSAAHLRLVRHAQRAARPGHRAGAFARLGPLGRGAGRGRSSTTPAWDRCSTSPSAARTTSSSRASC